MLFNYIYIISYIVKLYNTFETYFMAEREGFEPSHDCSSNALAVRPLNHLSISPIKKHLPNQTGAKNSISYATDAVSATPTD
jgi:hypothetical protein